MMEHNFTENIKAVLVHHFADDAQFVYEHSLLVQYINQKTRSANRGSKSRSSFANLYAIYVIVEDYINQGYVESGLYNKYEGAQYANLFKRQRELPFGNKLQNHALNNRMNAEFQKFFPTTDIIPILRNHETNRYWFNENLLKLSTTKATLNIAQAIIDIIDTYVQIKQDSFEKFISHCSSLQTIEGEDKTVIHDFIMGLLAPNVDARLFEIVSYSILKLFYKDQSIIWGYDMDNLNTEELKLYKTGRTNANDGGIDFVMKPLGRFFQVTETLDFKKYFLDIEKIEKYPITFVIKSDESVDNLLLKLKSNALKTYVIESIVDKYMGCLEELINIPMLKLRLEEVVSKGLLNNVLDEIIIQSKVEFNYEEEEDEENAEFNLQMQLNS